MAADYKRFGAMLTELGKRIADLGVQLGYHNHMGSMGETPDGVEQIMEAVDPRTQSGNWTWRITIRAAATPPRQLKNTATGYFFCT